MLITPGFDEHAVVICLTQMRKAGIATSLVKPDEDGLIESLNGLVVKADRSINQLINEGMDNMLMIVIPGVINESVAGEFVRAAIRARLFVAVFGQETNINIVESMLHQKDLPIEVFSQQLVNLVAWYNNY